MDWREAVAGQLGHPPQNGQQGVEVVGGPPRQAPPQLPPLRSLELHLQPAPPCPVAGQHRDANHLSVVRWLIGWGPRRGTLFPGMQGTADDGQRTNNRLRQTVGEAFLAVLGPIASLAPAALAVKALPQRAE